MRQFGRAEAKMPVDVLAVNVRFYFTNRNDPWDGEKNRRLAKHFAKRLRAARGFARSSCSQSRSTPSRC